MVHYKNRYLNYIRRKPLALLAPVTLLFVVYLFFFSSSSLTSSKLKYQYNKKSRGWFYKNRDSIILKNLPKNHISHYDLNKLSASKDALKHREEVLILTPMSKFYLNIGII